MRPHMQIDLKTEYIFSSKLESWPAFSASYPIWEGSLIDEAERALLLSGWLANWTWVSRNLNIRQHLWSLCCKDLLYVLLGHNWPLNNRFLRKRRMASTPKMEYQVFLCIFQKNSTIATLGLKEMGKFLSEGREKDLSCWLSPFSKTNLRQPTGQTFFPTFPQEFSHFLQT